MADGAWEPTLATVESWRRTYDTWFVDESTPDEIGTYQLARCVITFSYVASGKTYWGKYTAGSPLKIGETFEISFDPVYPRLNSAADKKLALWIRMMVWGFGIVSIFALIRIFPDTGW